MAGASADFTGIGQPEMAADAIETAGLAAELDRICQLADHEEPTLEALETPAMGAFEKIPRAQGKEFPAEEVAKWCAIGLQVSDHTYTIYECICIIQEFLRNRLRSN